MEQLQNAVSAFPESATLCITSLIFLFVVLVFLAALFRSQKGGE